MGRRRRLGDVGGMLVLERDRRVPIEGGAGDGRPPEQDEQGESGGHGGEFVK